MKGQSTVDCYWATKHCKGEEYVDMLFTDDARQLRRAANKLGITWDHSQAGVPRSNAIAEALVGSVCDAVMPLELAQYRQDYLHASGHF